MFDQLLSATDSAFCTLSSEEQGKILRFQQAILQSVIQSNSYLDEISLVCRLGEQLLPNSVGSVMLLDDAGKLLNVLVAPSIPPEGIATLNGIKPGTGSGSCGNVIYHQSPQFVSNTFSDPRWQDIRDIAYNFNLCSCWSVLIYSRNRKVIGTFALSSFEHRSPTSFHTILLEVGAAIISIMLDRKQSQDSMHLFEKVFEGSEEGIMVTDPNQKILSVNHAFTEFYGYTLDELRGQTPKKLASGQHGPEFFQALWKQINTRGNWRGEIWNRRKNGEIFPEWLSISAVYDQSNALTHYIGIFSDISELKSAEEQILYLSTHDNLTGLPNQATFKNRLEQALALATNHSCNVAVINLDLDKFKWVNHSLGLQAGDLLLTSVASALKQCLSDADSVCRIASDEFLIAISGCEDTETISTIVDKIIEKVAQPIQFSGQTLSLSCSVGIAVFPSDANNYDDLVKRASEARRQAKKSGGNCYHFSCEQLNTDSLEFLRISHELRDALAENRFVLHYQPQIDLSTGRLVGAEALIRWKHPSQGLLYPGKFIDIAEQTGLIADIGNWVLKEACSQSVAWQKTGLPPIVIAVNVSALQFRRGDIVKIVESVLEESGLQPNLLELELTESILLENFEQTLGQLNELKALGVKLSIDDFGTGYSSLSYLNRLNIDKLKIDQSFVRQIGNPANDAIIRAIIQMGHAMGYRVIAEGVETETMKTYLIISQCDEAQGYLFAKPVANEAFLQFVLEHKSMLQQGVEAELKI